jgi:hypothetical protein
VKSETIGGEVQSYGIYTEECTILSSLVRPPCRQSLWRALVKTPFGNVVKSLQDSQIREAWISLFEEGVLVVGANKKNNSCSSASFCTHPNATE